MTLTIRSVLNTGLLALALVFASCGSSQKKSDDLGSQLSTSDLENSFEVNSDSDSGRAGALRTVYFDFNSSTITGSTRSALDNNIEFLKQHTTVKVEIEGHADERGSVQYNLALGERRSKAVRDYMMSMGIAANRMTTISFGKERPIAFGHNEEAWGQNRRANFVITAK
jgi:peptidoglycan-associated lipoprotein